MKNQPSFKLAAAESYPSFLKTHNRSSSQSALTCSSHAREIDWNGCGWKRLLTHQMQNTSLAILPNQIGVALYVRITAMPDFGRLRRASRQKFVGDVPVPRVVLEIRYRSRRHVVIRVGEGRVRHLLQSLDGVANLETKGGNVLVQSGHLRVKPLDRLPHDDFGLLLPNLLVQVLVGDAFGNYPLVALDTDGAVVDTWTSRF